MEVIRRSGATGSNRSWSTAVRLRPMAEERANQITHGLGVVLSVLGTIYLYYRLQPTHDIRLWIGCSVYMTTMTLLFIASTLSHSFALPSVRHFFRTADQVLIFIFCSGSFTPFALAYLDGNWLILLYASWVMAIVGAAIKIYVAKLRTLSVVTYLMLGWLPVVTLPVMWPKMSYDSKTLILSAGLLYTLGTWFLVNDDRGRYWHAVWHLFVVTATGCVFGAVSLSIQ